MKLLALDSATEACSAALLVDGATRERFELIGRGHAERLLPMVDELLREAALPLDQLDAIAFGRGPGAFTGVRIAVSLAQGLALGAGLPLVPVSDLRAIGADALDRTPDADQALVCLDARMAQVYWGLARRGAAGGCELLAEGLAAPDAVPAPDGGALVLAGHGFRAYPALGRRFDGIATLPDLLPHAAIIAVLAAHDFRAGLRVSPAGAEPVYLRDEVATRSGRAPGPGPSRA